MPKTLEIVAQEAQDLYFRSYRVQTDFFTLEDFVAAAGSVMADLYRQAWENEYARLRSEGLQDEVVAFSTDLLIRETLKVNPKKGNEDAYAELKTPIFSFLYDKQNSGLQNVIANVPRDTLLERSNINEKWQYRYMPTSCRVFWRTDGKKIYFFSNGGGNVSEVEIYYVPAISPEALVPDILISIIVNQTVDKFKEKSQEVVKETNDKNSNKVLQTELNNDALK